MIFGFPPNTIPISDPDDGSITHPWYRLLVQIAQALGYYTEPGVMVQFAQSVVPSVGWLKCDGSAISRVGYSLLFARIGTTFGPGDGVSTFNLPNEAGPSANIIWMIKT